MTNSKTIGSFSEDCPSKWWHLEYTKYREYVKLSISKNKLRVLNIDLLLIKVNKTDGRRLIFYYIGILFFFHGHHENHPKWWVGPKISSVNILILNKGGFNEQYYTTPRGSLGVCMVTPQGPCMHGLIALPPPFQRCQVYEKWDDKPLFLRKSI